MFVPSNFVLVAGYLKHSSDTPNPNIHKYTNYNIIQIYINRLSTTTQISIAMDYLIMMSEKCIYFRKRKKHAARSFFTHPIEKTGSMYFKNISELSKMYKNSKQIGMIQEVSKLIIFVNL